MPKRERGVAWIWPPPTPMDYGSMSVEALLKEIELALLKTQFPGHLIKSHLEELMRDPPSLLWVPWFYYFNHSSFRLLVNALMHFVRDGMEERYATPAQVSGIAVLLIYFLRKRAAQLGL